MGRHRSRDNFEKSKECKSLASDNEAEQPSLKKLRPTVENSRRDKNEESESGSEAEKYDEEEEQSESDSGKDNFIAQGRNCSLRQNAVSNVDDQLKQNVAESEEEEDDSTEFESDGDSQEQNKNLGEEMAADNPAQSNAKEEDDSTEFESDDDSQEQNKNLAEKMAADNPAESSEEEEDDSKSEEYEEEDDESNDMVPEGDVKASSGHAKMVLGEKLSGDDLKQNVAVNEEEEDDSSEFESDGDSQEQNKNLGEKMAADNHSQSNEEEEDESTDLAPEGDVKASSGHAKMVLGKKLSNNDLKQNVQVNEEEGDSSSDSEEYEEEEDDPMVLVPEGGTEASNMKASKDSGEEFSIDNLKENIEVNEGEKDGSSESKEEEDDESTDFEPETGVKTSNIHANMDSGEKLSSDALKQIVVAKEGEEDESSWSESEASQDLDLGGELAGGKGGVVAHSRNSLVQKRLRNTPHQNKFSRKSKMEKSPYVKWSNDHVIALLEGLIKANKEGKAGSQNHNQSICQAMGGIPDFNHNLVQVKEKIRRLKNMYTRFAKGSLKKQFSSHESQVLELCAKLWGDNVKANNVIRSSGDFTFDECSKAKDVINEGLNLLKGSKRPKDFEKEWKQSRLQEIKLYLERLDIMKKHLDEVKDELLVALRSQDEAN